MSRGPWSIKGIDSKAKERARARAQRDGVTLGEYINRLLLDDGAMTLSHDDDDSADSFFHAADEANQLTRRLQAAPLQSGARTQQTQPRLRQSLQNILERLEANEQGHATLAGRVDSAMHDLDASQSALRAQVETMSRKDTSRRTLDAMRALEGALSRLAREVHDTHEKVNVEQARLRKDVEDVHQRVDDTLTDAAERVERAVEEAELRTEGVGRHLAQRMTEVESLINDSQSRVADSADRLVEYQQRAEDRVRQALERSESALDAVSRHTRETGERLDNAEKTAQGAAQMATDAVSRLDAHDKELRQRLKSIANLTDSKLDQVYSVAEEALETAIGRGDELDEKITGLKASQDAFDRRLDEAAHAVGRAEDRNKELADRLFGKLDEDRESVTRRLDATQQNVAAMMGRVNDADAAVSRVESRSTDALETLKAAMARIDARLEKAEQSSGRVEALETSMEAIDQRLKEATGKSDEAVSSLRDDFQQQVDTLTETLTRSLQDTRGEIESQIAGLGDGASSEAFSQLEERLDAMQAQLSETESRQAEAVEIITDQFERMSSALEHRLEALKSDADAATAQAVRDEVSKLSDELSERIGKVEDRDTAAPLEAMALEVSRLAEKLDERVRDSEHRSAEAIEQVGEQVVRATERLKADQKQGLDDLYGRIDASEAETRERIENVVQDVERKLEEAGDISRTAVQPMENTVASLARRVEAIEDMDVGAEPPPFIEDGMTEDDADFDDALEPPPVDQIFIEDEAPVAFEPPIAAPDVPLVEIEAEAEDDADSDEDADLDAAQIAASAHSARKEFAQHLAEHIAESRDADDEDAFDTPVEDEDNSWDADVELLDDLDEEDDTPPPPFEAQDESAEEDDDDLFAPGIVEAPPEPEYEADLPQTPDISLLADELRPDVGADDDPFGRASRNNLEFLKAARQAALERGGDNRTVLGSDDDTGQRSSKAPIAAATALAVAVAGGAGLMIMRGKQSNSDQSFATLPANTEAGAAAASAGVGAEAADLEGDLFDAREEALEEQAVMAAEAEVDESTLFPEEARILTPENIEAASAADEAVNTVSAEPAPRRVSPLEAFASRAPEPKETLQSAAAKGDPVALYELGTQKFNEGDKRGAAELLQRAADRGLTLAQYRLAKLYEKGEGVPRSVKESRKWTETAAASGNVKAMHDLAVFYAEGEGGGPQSYVGAVEWFTKAANHGLLDSQYNLGVLYEQGLGVSENKAEAAVWFDIAGRTGDADAARRARDLMAQLPPAEAEAARLRAASFVPMQADAKANGSFGPKAWEAAQPAQVREVQRLLNLLNFNAGTPDGLMGSRTRAAIRRYQATQGLPITGEVSPQLIDALRSQSIGVEG